MTSDMGELFNALKGDLKALKRQFGVNCPGCAERFPKACPSRLLPGWTCNTCGYTDPRPRLEPPKEDV